MTDAVSASVDGDAARVVATVVTEFADRDEPSIEDDIVYLARAGDRLADRQAELDPLPRDRRSPRSRRRRCSAAAVAEATA